MADIQFSVPKCRHWESIFLVLEQLIKGVGKDILAELIYWFSLIMAHFFPLRNWE
jgi:hypothetical protein